MDTVISFVIPVYNGEKVIRKCIESIESQDMSGCEVIVIDDGSVDKSGKILEELSAKYENLSILAGKHKGVVSARMQGLTAASGSYIWFVDADDLLTDGAVERTKRDITENSLPDIVAFRHELDENGKRRLADSFLKAGYYDEAAIRKDIFPYAFHDAGKSGFRHPIIDGFLWNKVWKKELIKESLCNDSRLSLFEDAISVFRALSVAKSILKSDDIRYVYVKGDSSTSAYRDDYFYNTFVSAEVLGEIVKSLPEDMAEVAKDQVNAFITERLIVSVTREVRYKKSVIRAYGFTVRELDKYRIQKDLFYKGLPFLIRVYLFLLKRHLYLMALLISRIMA